MTPQELKNSILQFAIQGKLVPQDSSEGTGEELYKEIQKEKQALIKAGKIRKEKPLPEITVDNVTFDIPESWMWCRLGDIGYFTRGNGIKKRDVVESGFPCIRYGQMYTTYKTSFNKTVSFVQKDIFDKSVKVKHGDIVMALTGENNIDIALAATYLGNDTVAMGGDMTKYTHFAFPLFLVYAINSSFCIKQKSEYAKGNIIVHISNDKLATIMVPLPPLAEQKRIVAKIEELLPLVDQYEEAYNKLEELNKSFPMDLQKSILQMAIQGKLVPQDPSEGTGEELYKEVQAEKQALIKAGKTKKEKPIPEITEDIIPFDIPDSWKWAYLGSVSELNGGYAFKSTDYSELGVRVIRISDFNEKGFVDTKIVRHPFKEEYTPFILEEKNILLCMTGGTVGKSYFVQNINEKMMVNQRVATIKNKYILPEYINFLILSPLIQSIIQHSKNSTNDNISMDTIKRFPVPLPPLAEQKLIVSKLEVILPLCEKLGFYNNSY